MKNQAYDEILRHCNARLVHDSISNIPENDLLLHQPISTHSRWYFTEPKCSYVTFSDALEKDVKKSWFSFFWLLRYKALARLILPTQTPQKQSSGDVYQKVTRMCRYTFLIKLNASVYPFNKIRHSGTCIFLWFLRSFTKQLFGSFM